MIGKQFWKKRKKSAVKLSKTKIEECHSFKGRAQINALFGKNIFNFFLSKLSIGRHGLMRSVLWCVIGQDACPILTMFLSTHSLTRRYPCVGLEKETAKTPVAENAWRVCQLLHFLWKLNVILVFHLNLNNVFFRDFSALRSHQIKFWSSLGAKVHTTNFETCAPFSQRT